VVVTLNAGELAQLLALEELADERVVLGLLFVALEVDCLGDVGLLRGELPRQAVQELAQELLGVLLLVVVEAWNRQDYRAAQVDWSQRQRWILIGSLGEFGEVPDQQQIGLLELLLRQDFLVLLPHQEALQHGRGQQTLHHRVDVAAVAEVVQSRNYPHGLEEAWLAIMLEELPKGHLLAHFDRFVFEVDPSSVGLQSHHVAYQRFFALTG